MIDLLKILESFNRKERYFLIRQALGLERFDLCDAFRTELNEAVGIEVPKEEEVFVAMDYHLDWIAASLALFESGEREDNIFSNPDEVLDGKSYKLVQGTQEDIDLLVAFGPDSESIYHLVFLEAKAYEGNGFAIFDRSQLKSKGARLLRIFGENEKTSQRYEEVKPYFYLTSKKKPDPMTNYDSPWSKEKWIEMNLPLLDEKRIVERFDSNSRKPNWDGNHFRIRKLK